MMTTQELVQRHEALLVELKALMSQLGKWRGMPALLDELAVLRQLLEQRRAQDALTGA